MTRLFIATLFGVLSLPITAQELTAILINPTGSDNGFETVQIEGTPGASLNNIFFISIEGDDGSGSSTGIEGVVDGIIDLSGNSIGSNGIFLIRDASTAILPGPAPQTSILVNNFSPDLENGSNTFLLATNVIGSINGTDLDADDDGIIDSDPWDTVLDAVAVKDAGSDFEYATPYGGQVVTRIGCPSDPNSMIYTPGFVFRTPDDNWAGAFPINNGDGTLSYDDFDVHAADCSSLASTYGDEIILLGGQGFLPVSWGGVAAHRQGDKVKISWTTTSEEDNQFFTVERSQDGRNFLPLGDIPAGRQRSPGTQEYAFMDITPLSVRSIYRIKQTDVDGAFSYSSMVAVEALRSIEANSWSVFPTVTEGVLTVMTADELNTAGILSIYSAIGPHLRDLPIQNDLTRINVSDLPSGWYVLRLEGHSPLRIYKK